MAPLARGDEPKTWEAENAARGGPAHRGVSYIIPKTCDVCGADFMAVKNRGKYARFCSRKCAGDGQRQAQKTVPKTCEQCGADYFADRYKAAVSKYCSPECRVKAMPRVGRVAVQCIVCGKEHRRFPKDIRAKMTCSRECHAVARYKDEPGTNGWANVRRWFSRNGRMRACEECGYDERTEILVVHHKDRNRDNNALTNLAVLCPNCHAIEHLADRRDGWKAARANKEAARSNA